jgi:hypothetical protein
LPPRSGQHRAQHPVEHDAEKFATEDLIYEKKERL